MTEKTVAEINQEHGRNAVSILTGYQDVTDEVRAEEELEVGAYLDRWPCSSDGYSCTSRTPAG